MAGMKLRPVLLLTGAVGLGTEVLAAYISSVIPPTLLATDLLLDPAQSAHQSTRLKATSILRLHKLATLHVTSLQRYVGRLSPEALLDVDARLRQLLTL